MKNREKNMNEPNSDNGVATQIEDGRRAWAGERLTALDKQARSFLTQHPIAALACAVGLGFVAARLLGGRRTK